MILGKEMEADEKTIRTIVKDLGLKSYVRRERQLLTATGKEKRLARSRILLNFLKRNSGLVFVFSDEKNSKVDGYRNARNDCYLTSNPTNVPPIMRTKHPATAMSLGVVYSDGRAMPPYWC